MLHVSVALDVLITHATLLVDPAAAVDVACHCHVSICLQLLPLDCPHGPGGDESGANELDLEDGMTLEDALADMYEEVSQSCTAALTTNQQMGPGEGCHLLLLMQT